ncbi:hypothetical protein XH89_12740 [Bradyrhizobium sp. CCBAU 53340]|uniref:DUF3455 domain-containing protein n=1 Tax=Bradyrhizobium sp. CCBAU 53340 TaxID=1325112 RepID=UPI001889DEB0|nr:DUF3455 domain-containing protein [Bradyrhizobium sp. CCBAU 53340]QOZ44257.1 hypothetical protein XH89_12740 [Bradyrhizobium sp. CCBAU 53340]
MSTKLAVPCLLLFAAIAGPATAADPGQAEAPRGAIRLVGFPEAIQAPGEQTVAVLFAEGAQIYECKPAADGKLAWSFREPIATLLENGKTVGRHYAGPNWEHQDSSAVTGKVTGSAPGETDSDIPRLKLEVTSRRGSGLLSEVTTVQRVLTHGGKLDGACDKAGDFKSVPYSATYIFLKKG